MAKAYNMLIGGKWVNGKGRMEVRNPYDGQVLGTVPIATKGEVEAAIDSAQRAFQTFSQMPAHQRSKILENTSNLLNERKREVAETLSKESGKPIRDATGEVSRAVQTFKFAAEE
ncbi:MAG: aldehyde dehydrogenase family protein, partial [candidate division NC10 bacterium]|nr:aldehyde dehydrogenase family protein [candidate division NC10 bacterium]